MDAGVLPVKSFARAKGRLSEIYGPEEREVIARAMFTDALTLCLACRDIAWWIVSDEPDALTAARGAGMDAIRDEGTGLNQALRQALKEVERAGATTVTALPADVPLARPDDIAEIIEVGGTSDVVVVPSGGDGGTNGLHMSSTSRLEPSFGPGSLHAHVAQADRLGLRCTVLPVAGLVLDIDSVADVAEFLGVPGANDTATGRALIAMSSSRS